MGNGLEYKDLHCSESFGSYGGFGIKILVASTRMPDLSGEAIRSAVYDAARLISAEIQAASIGLDEKAQERSKSERQQLLGLFSDSIFVEDIPNGYCSDWCCRHLPWFRVTTPVGHFRIGWRKRVIHIEWTDTVVDVEAKDLFPDEDVTRYDCIIHAWSLEDAKRYISTIMDSAK